VNRLLKFVALGLGGLIALLALAWFFMYRGDIPFETLEARYANPHSQWLNMPGRLRVHYRDQGNSKGPAVIMVHGFSASLHAWEPWVTRLGDRYRIITLDLPGHGLTDAPSNYVAGQDSNADIVDALARNLYVDRYVVVGNSMGGGVAWEDALRHPDHVRGLILVDSVGLWQTRKSGDSGPLIFKILANPIGRALLRDLDVTPLARSGLKTAYGDPKVVTPELVTRYVDLSRAPGHRDVIMNMRFARHAPITAESFKAIKAPTLVLHGEADKLIPLEAGKALAAAIPGARLITYPGVGHVPMETIPDRSAADVRAFLDGLPPEKVFVPQ